MSGSTFYHGWGWQVNSCIENHTCETITSPARVPTGASPRDHAVQSRRAIQTSYLASLASPTGLKLAAAIQRHPQYLQYLRKRAGSWSGKGKPGDPRGRCTVKVSFADGIHRALTATHWDPAVFPMTVRHLQPLSFGLIAAKASKSKQAQESYTHKTNQCVGRNV